MTIAVCLKQVVTREWPVRVGSPKSWIDERQASWELNEPDAYALEAALTLREQHGGFEQRNLIGSPEEICERIRVYEQAGVTTCSGLLFVANTVPEMQDAIELFGREVIPNFKG